MIKRNLIWIVAFSLFIVPCFLVVLAIWTRDLRWAGTAGAIWGFTVAALIFPWWTIDF